MAYNRCSRLISCESNINVRFVKTTLTILAHYRKPVIRHVPKSSPCANHRAHGEESLCRGPNTEHTAKIKPTAEGGFAVCPNLGQNYSLPCASERHTTKIGPRGQSITVGQRRHILPCASVRHTANLHLYRVPHGGTRQT